MVTAQISKQHAVPVTALHPLLYQRVRGHFHHHMADLLRRHGAEQRLQLHCLGRGKRRGQLSAPMAIAHRPDHTRRPPPRLPDRFKHIGRGGLAAGAGYADQREAGARPVVGTGSHETKQGARCRRNDHRDLP